MMMITVMIRAVLIFVFILLWKFNVMFCGWVYPDYITSAEVWDEWYLLRSKIYEVMFLLGVLALFFNETKHSYFMKWVAFVVVSASVVDKILQNVHFELLRDWAVVYPFSIVVAYFMTKHQWQKERV